jgi:hypothetical protein
MKKIFSVTMIFLLAGFTIHAQTFDEWFRQNKTQIKYLVSQIAALEIYDGELNEGYTIDQNGLTDIFDYKKGEYGLHNDYFSSLKAVNPSVAGYSRISDIISYQQSIMEQFKKVLAKKNITSGEMSYLQSVYNHMTTECIKSLNELTDLVTAGTYTMKDDERIKRIDAIYADMKDKYAFTQSFTSEANLLSGERASEQNDIDMSLINNSLK